MFSNATPRFFPVALVTASVSIPLVWYAFRKINAFKHYRWGYRPGSISGFFARLLEEHSQSRRNRAPLRVYMDGCFDMMHYGHANALRQARACGDVLVVGLIPDKEIERVKGPPVLNNEERLAMVKAVKWVDEVITDTPYEITEEFMQHLFEKHKIDVIVHGDDPCLLPDGTDAYAHVKRLGRFVTIKRTEGVSTTDLVGRLLMCVKRPPENANLQASHLLEFCSNCSPFSTGSPPDTPKSQLPCASMPLPLPPPAATRVSHFLPTSRRFVQFSSGRQPDSGATIVFLDGAFDMFHAGHVAVLKAARALGDFLLVGIHPDDVIEANRGRNHPIQSLHERSLSVLACRYVDEVVLGTPWVLTRDLLLTFNISIVVHGTTEENNPYRDAKVDPYAVPKEMGIFKLIVSPHQMTTSTIIDRIMKNHEAYEARNAMKMVSEQKYYGDQKEFINEK